MSLIKIGCQTYTWEMLGDKWTGSVDDMVDMVARAGYSGIEITNTMIGKYYDTPDEFRKLLDEKEIKFCAFGFIPIRGFTDDTIIEEEIAAVKKGIEFISHFPECRLVLAGGSSSSREKIEIKFETMCSIYNRTGQLASEKQIPVDIHAHSHAGSIIESEAEYDKLLAMTDKDFIGWNPDTGHIIRGGSDLLHLLEKHKSRIGHLHFKDVDTEGNWKRLGEGIAHYESIFRLLENIRFDGWIVGEEESAEAWNNQYESILWNRKYMKSLGY